MHVRQTNTQTNAVDCSGCMHARSRLTQITKGTAGSHGQAETHTHTHTHLHSSLEGMTPTEVHVLSLYSSSSSECLYIALHVRSSGVPDLYPSHTSLSFVGGGNDVGTSAPCFQKLGNGAFIVRTSHAQQPFQG